MLTIDETELLELFEAEPEIASAGIWMRYVQTHKGINLEFTVWQYDAVVLISMRQESTGDELLHLNILGALRVTAFNQEKRPFLQVEYPSGSNQADSTDAQTARIFIRPNIQVAMIAD